MKCLQLKVLLSCSIMVSIQAMEWGPTCKVCKKVEGEGPLAGMYNLQSDKDMRCADYCSYAKDNEFYCFEPGNEVVVECGDEMKPTPGEEKTTPEMKPITFMPPAPPGTDMPPAENVKCGMRNNGGCIKDGRIVNGQEAGCNEWPWQVGIVRRDGDAVSTSPFCGGTLINENHVITAAHCMPDSTTSNIAIMIGDHSLTVAEPAQRAYGVSAIYNHPDYDDSSQANDITVLKLSVNVNTTKYSPACFPSFSSGQSLNGKNGTISGWGALEYATGDYPEELQEVQDLIPIVDRDTCVTNTEPYIYDSDIMPGMLCAGGPGLGMDTCQGDSGGPLTHQFAPNQYQLVGVVSWGRDCAKSYGVYSDVAYYKTWIESKTGPMIMAP